MKSFDNKSRDNIHLKSWCPWSMEGKCYSPVFLKTLKANGYYSAYEDILGHLILLSATALRSTVIELTPYAFKKKTGHRSSLDIRVDVSSWHLFLICIYLISLQILIHLFQMNMEHFICLSFALLWSI